MAAAALSVPRPSSPLAICTIDRVIKIGRRDSVDCERIGFVTIHSRLPDVNRVSDAVLGLSAALAGTEPGRLLSTGTQFERLAFDDEGELAFAVVPGPVSGRSRTCYEMHIDRAA